MSSKQQFLLERIVLISVAMMCIMLTHYDWAFDRYKNMVITLFISVILFIAVVEYLKSAQRWFKASKQPPGARFSSYATGVLVLVLGSAQMQNEFYWWITFSAFMALIIAAVIAEYSQNFQD